MLNHIVIMGRLTKDPELRTTQSGVSVTSFTLAVDRDSKRDNGGSDYGSPPPYGMPAASYGAGGSSAPGGYAPPGGESEGFSDMDDDDGDLPF